MTTSNWRGNGEPSTSILAPLGPNPEQRQGKGGEGDFPEGGLGGQIRSGDNAPGASGVASGIVNEWRNCFTMATGLLMDASKPNRAVTTPIPDASGGLMMNEIASSMQDSRKLNDNANLRSEERRGRNEM